MILLGGEVWIVSSMLLASYRHGNVAITTSRQPETGGQPASQRQAVGLGGR